MQSTQTLTLRGVRVHNLKNIDVEIPLHRLTVVTGVSGAGKSSLVFDTLYAEAQRRYLQSFSVYTRQFLERFDKPDAEFIGDLPPAVAIRRSPSTSQATVGALSELDASLRLLFARAGTLVCPGCGHIVKSQNSADVVSALGALPPGTRCTIAFPVEATEDDAWQSALREEGYVRVQIEGALYRLDDKSLSNVQTGRRVWVLLDRIEIGKTSLERVQESIDAAFRRGGGQLGVLTEKAELVFDQRYYCQRCRRVFPAPEPRLFDPDDPLGACAECQGRGTRGKTGEPCSQCNGRRWCEEALAVKIAGKNIAEWNALSIRSLWEVVRGMAVSENEAAIVASMQYHLLSLVRLRVGHLSLQQSAAAIGEGATLRIRLATALSSNLVNVLYLFEEPTLGLHASAFGAVATTLRQLRDQGNTVVVVEHERAILAAADFVLDLGPGAGEEGGDITYHGPPDGLQHAAENPTSDFWTRRSFVEVPKKRRKPAGWKQIRDLKIPLNVLSVVCGENGANLPQAFEADSLKSTSRQKKPGGKSDEPKSLSYLLLDQSPFARGARSNPATYVKIFDEIRDLFAQAVDAKIRNYGPGHFSFNQPGGRCEACEGQGTQTIDMQFLADVHAVCPECHGRRYRKEILDIKVRSLSIAEVLDLTVREAFRFFRAQPAIEKKLKVLLDVGLDYLRLGQSMESLSGSECQRLKLAAQLASSRKTGSLYVILEPSAGLHPADVVEFLDCMERLLSAGHSVVIVDNDLDIIKCADWVIEIGPGNDASVAAAGTPEEIAKLADSSTGALLKAVLSE